MNAIYGIKCIINNKYYVGATTALQQRWKTHKRSLKNGSHHSRKLQRAWIKHGENNFIFEILEGNLKYNELIAKEQFWMDFLESYDNGYNGYSKSTPCPASMRNGMFGKEPRNKGLPSKERKKVTSYDILSGEVQHFEYVAEVTKITGFGPQFLGCINLEKIEKNRYSNYKGRFWFYSEEFDLENLKSRFEIKNKINPLIGRKRTQKEKENISKGRKGMKFSPEHVKNISIASKGRGIKKILRSDGIIFNSIQDAADKMCCDRSNISHVLIGNSKTCRGYSFSYLKE